MPSRNQSGLPATFQVDRESPIPLHYQLSQQLREAIVSGRLGVDTAIPPEPNLAETTGVSRSTVRQAIDPLVREGLLHRERGRGTFVQDAAAKVTSTDAVTELQAAVGAYLEHLDSSGGTGRATRPTGSDDEVLNRLRAAFARVTGPA